MLKYLSIKAILFYKKYLSRGTCMYVPTCSSYMLEAIYKYGFFRGFLLGVFRILRCVPWAKGGLDKVPDKKSDLKWIY